MRHFALEQGRRGFAVHYVQTAEAYDSAIKGLAHLGAIDVMEPGRTRAANVAGTRSQVRGIVRTVPHEGWLSDPSDFHATQKAEGPWRMDRFYRHMRQKTGLLMDGKKPEGGKYSFDADNRQPWKGEPALPTPPTFSPDEITLEVCELVATQFSHHPGELSPQALPATDDDAQMLWNWAKQSCMVHFGPFEDAMTHSVEWLVSHPHLASAQSAPPATSHGGRRRRLPGHPASVEGKASFAKCWDGESSCATFTAETDGFRSMPGGVRPSRGEDPWRRWLQSLGRRFNRPSAHDGLDGGAKPNALGAKRAIPPVFWGEASGLACLDRVVQDVWSEAYSHHITRLMILCNLAALLDLEPRQVSDWFWVAYADAYDWVVEPNVLGMGLFATGELMTTKPYISGTPYIQKMSDYCQSCRFPPQEELPDLESVLGLPGPARRQTRQCCAAASATRIVEKARRGQTRARSSDLRVGLENTGSWPVSPPR